MKHIKERVQCVCHAAPYKRYTRLMTISLIEGVVDILNFFPSENGISEDLAPSTIVEGRQKLDMNKKRAEFGAYALVYTGTENNMRKRGVPAIALKASNDVGGFYFMSLYTGKKIHGYIWNEIPIDDDVISRVEELADKENQPLLIDDHPLFEWAPGRPIASDTFEESELDNETEQ